MKLVKFSLNPALAIVDKTKKTTELTIIPLKIPNNNPKKRLTGESPVFFIIKLNETSINFMKTSKKTNDIPKRRIL